jgi:hypothetical protein
MRHHKAVIPDSIRDPWRRDGILAGEAWIAGQARNDSDNQDSYFTEHP